MTIMNLIDSLFEATLKGNIWAQMFTYVVLPILICIILALVVPH